MDSDVIMVTGIVVLMLSIPSAVASFADGRRPWIALLVIVIGGGILGWGWIHHPETMSLGEIPHVIVRVMARILP